MRTTLYATVAVSLSGCVKSPSQLGRSLSKPIDAVPVRALLGPEWEPTPELSTRYRAGTVYFIDGQSAIEMSDAEGNPCVVDAKIEPETLPGIEFESASRIGVAAPFARPAVQLEAGARLAYSLSVSSPTTLVVPGTRVSLSQDCESAARDAVDSGFPVYFVRKSAEAVVRGVECALITARGDTLVGAEVNTAWGGSCRLSTDTAVVFAVVSRRLSLDSSPQDGGPSSTETVGISPVASNGPTALPFRVPVQAPPYTRLPGQPRMWSGPGGIGKTEGELRSMALTPASEREYDLVRPYQKHPGVPRIVGQEIYYDSYGQLFTAEAVWRERALDSDAETRQWIARRPYLWADEDWVGAYRMGLPAAGMLAGFVTTAVAYELGKWGEPAMIGAGLTALILPSASFEVFALCNKLRVRRWQSRTVDDINRQ